MQVPIRPNWKKWLFRLLCHVVLCVLLYFSWPIISYTWRLLSSEGLAMRGFWKIWWMFLWMLEKVFWATLPCLLPPILAYFCICLLTDKRIFRLLAGIGAIYLFYTFSGDITFSLIGVLNLIKLVFQLYFLLILVVPDIFMNLVNTVTCVIGSIVIYIFPSLPGFLDDLIAICVLITMVFAYINSLAIGVKRVSDWVLERYVFKGGGYLTSNQRG